MVRLNIDMRRLAYWGIRERLIKRDGDIGYALHAALKEAFADYSPQPFRLFDLSEEKTSYTDYSQQSTRLPDMAEKRAAYLLGYSDWDREDIVASTQKRGNFFTTDVFDLQGIAAKPMPAQWGAGTRYEFEVRIRPTVRTKLNANTTRSHEQDVYRHYREQLGDAPAKGRSEVYIEWLHRQFEQLGGARLTHDSLSRQPSARMVRFRISPTSFRDNSRKLKMYRGPDAIIKGVLEISDEQKFHSMLRRGIGRSRAFGFGMLLLKPAR